VSPKPPGNDLSPHEIIANGKWDHALFTTYALSLTFFETHILKAGLIRNGCQTVWVVADVDGYHQTLTERQSARVGQEYHLVPVALPNGVFHPKCIYLSGPNGDMLLVGSGNLTFGGFGRNVEVLEVLTAAECPWVFHAFGKYLEALGSRKDFMNPDPRWIKIFSDLSFNAAKGVSSAPVEGPHLVHCVNSPIVGQLEDYFIAAGGASRLRFLSPFYDPNADAVREVAGKAGCQRITIGLLAGREEEGTFPFNVDLGKELKLEAAVLSAKKDSRSLHAKWLEADLKDGHRLILTGSVNATRKSLCTADNIEVGLVRLQSNKAAKYLQWEPTKLPQHFERRSFSKAGLGNRWVVHARFTRETLLEGKLMGSNDPAGKWESFLARADGERVQFTANVCQDGTFRVPVPHAEHYATTTSVQITLRRGESEAVGWLHMEAILDLPRLPRLGVTSLMRLVNNEHTEDDDAALLEYLALSAQNHLFTFKLEVKPRTKREPTTHQDDGDHSLRVDLERLAPANEDSAIARQHAALPTSEDYLDEIFGRLRRRMLTSLGAKGSRGISGATTEETKSEDEPPNDEDEAQPRNVMSGLRRFEEKMRELADVNGAQDYLKAVFNMWLEVELLMRIERLKDLEGAEFFCRKWVSNAVQRCRKEVGISTFDRHLVTVTVTLAANIIGNDKDGDAVVRLVQLHEDLERYCGGPVSPDFVSSALVTEPGLVLSDRLRLTQGIGLAEALKQMLTTRTFRQEIELILSWQSGQPLPVDLQILKTPGGKMLAERMGQTSKLDLCDFKAGRNSCPKCHLEIHRSVRDELQAYRISKCLNCGRFIINRG
jgi:hypothetical protein